MTASTEKNLASRTLIKSCCVYYPSVILDQSIEIIDAPGVEKQDAIKQANLEHALENSDQIFCLVGRSLKDSGGVINTITQDLLPRMIGTKNMYYWYLRGLLLTLQSKKNMKAAFHILDQAAEDARSGGDDGKNISDIYNEHYNQLQSILNDDKADTRNYPIKKYLNLFIQKAFNATALERPFDLCLIKIDKNARGSGKPFGSLQICEDEEKGSRIDEGDETVLQPSYLQEDFPVKSEKLLLEILTTTVAKMSATEAEQDVILRGLQFHIQDKVDYTCYYPTLHASIMTSGGKITGSGLDLLTVQKA